MSIKAETSFSLKDDLFNQDTVAQLASRLAAAEPGFRRAAFSREVLQRFPELALKERIQWIVRTLEKHLAAPYPKALKVLERTLPEPLDPTRSDDDFGQYIWIVPSEYAARHGCTAQHLQRSLEFLREATKRFSAENAIRPFLREYPDETLSFVRDCAEDDNYHVRRLASEGIRPLLPWAERVALPSTDIVAVLTTLHADSTRYVTRSVANTLNDISKSDPDLVIDTLAHWRQLGRQQPAELDWMTRHALRTLTKRDNPRALELLGYPARPGITIKALNVPTRVQVGTALEMNLELLSKSQQNLLISLRLHFLKANGQHAPKVFALKKAPFQRGEVVRMSKTLSFKPMTTRVLYPGQHLLDVVINGKTFASAEFELTPP